MSAINIALLGFGTVGKGTFEMIQKHQDRLRFFMGKPVKVVAVLVRNKEKHQLADDQVLLTDKVEDILQLQNLDVVIDAIYGSDPGFTYLKQFIEKGCHIVTANKEMFAHHGGTLLDLAKVHQVSVGFEATVAGGIPVIQTLRKLLNINRVTKIEGIVNGTSNFILSSMRDEELAFSQALHIAQQKGYAEADPTNDIEGFDAYYKALILSRVVFGDIPLQENITIKGISTITRDDISAATSIGLRFKHTAKLEKKSNKINCEVQPVLVADTHPFYNIEGVHNAVSIGADIVGNLSLTGPGAGKYPTASAVIEDLIHLYQENPKYFAKREEIESVDKTLRENRQWLILNTSLDFSELPHTFTEVDRLNDNVIFFKAIEEDVSFFEIQHPDVTVYPVDGEFFFSKKQMSV